MAYHIFIQAPLGQGKTLLMSLLAHYWKKKVEDGGGKIELFSNYELADSKPINHYTDWYEVAEAQGSICCWDECQMAFSNRKWSRHGSTIATEVMMFTRKMKSVQMYCSPSISNVDSRIRQIVEVLVDVRQIPNRGFSIRFSDYQTGEMLNKTFLPMSKAKKFFDLELYDTHQMVKGFPLPQTERESDKFFDTLEEIHDRARGKKKKQTIILDKNDGINVKEGAM
ncbi:zonular occludens toxin domain-containing protein [Bacillus cereus]|uniref:zonular occludens toxin domain-containing protein n=1 Tax=Bacillus cereus TaxID=1396 RepID=UPI001D0E6A68|nr:zonular occludens toxin domain-containing protein [Bacillus cereus]MCC2370347.1 ATPase [Bacillus cereus]MCC2491389.1 ATPase [Bacillus cereus]MDF9457542.1 zonular occludens toxin domain-containing protein [Bacillus cereus]MDF9644950.1 zonular occludens toxin domain-containing protein [Bacillus cereus]